MPNRLKKYPEIFEKVMEDREQFEMEFVTLKCAFENTLSETTGIEEQIEFRTEEVNTLNAEISELDKLIQHYEQALQK